MKNGLILAFVILLIGCRSVVTASSPDTQTTSVNLGDVSTGALPEAAGRLAYIAADGNVYITTPDLSSTTAVTNDATAPWEGIGLSYQRISWSPEGHLAFAAVTRTGSGDTTSKLYVILEPDKPARLVGQSDEHFVIYVYWSPVACPEQPACRHLAYLIEEDGNIALRLVKMAGDQIENRVIGAGWPYYFSWAANGESILWHTDGTYRFNDKAQIALYNLKGQHSRPFPHKPASFMAPAWSPNGEAWLGASSDATGDYLRIFGQEPPIILSKIPKGGAAFAWSPSGNQVAYALRESSTNPFFGPIFVYDLATGQSTQITDHSLLPVAFFWDPNGGRVGYLTHLTMPDSNWMQWRVYDLNNKDDRGFKAFNPSLHMRYIMGSFNQYAQSHRFWSPDGRYLVYGDQHETHGERVWLIDTWDNDGNNAALVGGGTMGFWSWN